MPRRYINAASKYVVVVENNIANVYSDSELNSIIAWQARIPHAVLNFDNATDCIDGAYKLDQRPVTCGFEDAAAVFGYPGSDRFARTPCDARPVCGRGKLWE